MCSPEWINISAQLESSSQLETVSSGSAVSQSWSSGQCLHLMCSCCIHSNNGTSSALVTLQRQTFRLAKWCKFTQNHKILHTSHHIQSLLCWNTQTGCEAYLLFLALGRGCGVGGDLLDGMNPTKLWQLSSTPYFKRQRLDQALFDLASTQ